MAEKRAGKDRRNPDDRRKNQGDYTGPERRNGEERRSGKDRRDPDA